MPFLSTRHNAFSLIGDMIHQTYRSINRSRNHASVKRVKQTPHATGTSATDAFASDNFTHRFKVVDYLIVFVDFSLLDVHIVIHH